MHSPYVDENTAHLVAPPKRSHWPLVLLIPVGATALIAAGAFVVMIISMVF